MENCEPTFNGKFLKNIRLVLELTQEKMAGDLEMSSSMLRIYEQKNLPISPRVHTRVTKRLPNLILKTLIQPKFNSILPLKNPIEMGVSDWEEVLESLSRLSPEAFEKNQMRELARLIHASCPYRSIPRDSYLGERFLVWDKISPNSLASEPSQPEDQNISATASLYSDPTDQKANLTAKIDKKLLEHLNKEADGDDISELLESIVSYYFESKKLFGKRKRPVKTSMKNKKKTNSPVVEKS
ncbi:hypothetical protein [Desulfomonile tiedjei]|uniref:Uncharacterized protein n=1 Tax=Desulfomonile tiedjei (strain ATCC 49306 / DSM 6799 / DCB-1) TaxID=706587 RepID=I4C172_DESTA|nr:hypothetical protein [Desulfomonile tiedjei]AFM23313.1 hypothetical protein Desti_0582 [Desulfomonile tiedjei DSM 6799]